jgi:DNA-binding NarL/FixJ family response regulator
MDQYPPPETITVYISRLTPRQIEIIEHVANGETNKQIAALLSISPRTVSNHISDARARLKADNRIQLVAVFIAWKYSSLTLPQKSV